MRKALCLCLLLLMTGAAAGVDLGAARNDARSGDAAYEAGDFEKAVELYSKALDEGLDHADLHFNLGNAYYKSGDLGRAILGYRRALRRDPRHADARENLAQATATQRDEAFKPLELPLFLKPLQWVYTRVSLNEWATLGLSLAFLLSASLIAAQWGWISAAFRRRILWPGCALMLVCFLLCGLRYREEVLRGAAIVVAEEVDVRSGPGSGYNLSFRVHEGLRLFISERRADWLQIHLGGELVGWVPADQVELI